MQVSEKDRAKAPVLGLKGGLVRNGPTGKKAAKLKASSWYKVSAQSIGISDKTLPERRDKD
jgi:hypothetical protein